MELFLKLKNITVSFDNRTVLNDINYKFSHGIYVIKGESGVGKTTLLNAIAGYLEAAKGEVEYSKNASLKYCMQEEAFFCNLTVKENFIIKSTAIQYEIDENQIYKLLSKFGIGEHLESKVSSLSGGEKQRLKMAMMLIDEPNIILLDEPTSMLDDNNKKRLTKEIESVWKEQLLIISSHDTLEFSRDVKKLMLTGGKLNEI